MTAAESSYRGPFFSTLTLDVLARGLSALSLVLLVRSLATPAFAYVVLLQSVSQFVGSPLAGGVRIRYMRREAERVSRGDAVPVSYVNALLLILAVIGVMSLGALAAAEALGLGSSSRERAGFVLLAALMGSGYALIELSMHHHLAHRRFARAGAIGVSRGGALFAGGVLAAVGLVDGAEAISAWMAAAMLLAGVGACVPILLRERRTRARRRERLRFDPESSWLTVYFLVSGGYAYFGMFLVALLLSEEDLASYGAAWRYIAIVMGPMPALVAVLRVRTAQHDVIDSPRIQRSLLVDWMRRAAPPVVLLLAAAALAAPFAIPIVDGGAYPRSVPVFQILLIAAAMQYVTMPSVNLLMAQGRYRLLAGIYAAQLLLASCVSVPAALALGAVGVAGAYSLAAVGETATTTRSALRHARRQVAGGPTDDVARAAELSMRD